MKRLIIVAMVLGLLFTGCASIQSVLNSAPVDFMCSPTAEQQATATAMLTALDAAQTAGAIFYPALGVAQASAVLQVIQAGGCFVVAQLKAALETVDAANASMAKAKGPAIAAVTLLPRYEPLRKLVK